MDTLLEALIESPDLPQKLATAQRVMEQERKRRKRFYKEMREGQKIEFINGEVIVQPPNQFRHIEASDNIQTLLSIYVAFRGLGIVTHEKLLICLTRNDYSPDVSFFRKEVADRFHPDQMQFPAPDFIAEILSPSTERIDRRIKKRDYAVHGVVEYWIIDPEAQSIEQHTLAGGDYQLLGKWQGDDLVTSAAVAGFRIPARAIFERQANLDALAALSK